MPLFFKGPRLVCHAISAIDGNWAGRCSVPFGKTIVKHDCFIFELLNLFKKMPAPFAESLWIRPVHNSAMNSSGRTHFEENQGPKQVFWHGAAEITQSRNQHIPECHCDGDWSAKKARKVSSSDAFSLTDIPSTPLAKAAMAAQSESSIVAMLVAVRRQQLQCQQ